MYQQNSISDGEIIEAKHIQYPNRYFKIVKLVGKRGEQVYEAESFNWMVNQKGPVALKFQSLQQKSESEIQFMKSLIDYQVKYETPQADETYLSGVIKIYDIFNWKQFQIVVMELGSTDLYQDIQFIQENQQLSILKQISLSIRFLHYNQIIHRDLKPENYIKIGNVFKLIDFGLTRQQNNCMTVGVGTPLFWAPELANGSDQYSTSADIWSLGCVFFEVMAKQPLFQTNNQQQQKLLLQDHMINTSNIFNRIDQLVTNHNIKQIIKEMLHPIPSNRIKIDEIIKRLNEIPQIPVTFPLSQQKTINNWQFSAQGFQQSQINERQQQNKLDQYFKGLNDKLDKFSLDIDQKIENKTNSLLQNILIQQDANFIQILQQQQMAINQYKEKVNSFTVKQEELKHQLQTLDENTKIIIENINQLNQNNQNLNENIQNQLKLLIEPINNNVENINSQQIQTSNQLKELIQKNNEQYFNLQNLLNNQQYLQEFQQIKLIMNQNQTNVKELNIDQKLLDLNLQNQNQYQKLLQKLNQLSNLIN